MKLALDEWLRLALIDPDGDGITNVAEFHFHLSPHLPNNANLSVDVDLDSDGDTFTNREEIAHGSDPSDPFNQPEATLSIVSGDDQYLSTDDDGGEVVVTGLFYGGGTTNHTMTLKLCDTFTSTSLAMPRYIGGQSTTGNGFHGKVGEVLLYNRTLTSDEQRIMRLSVVACESLSLR